MRTIQIMTLTEAVEPLGGDWNDPATGGESLLRYQIRCVGIQKLLADAIEAILETEADACYFGEFSGTDSAVAKVRSLIGDVEAEIERIIEEAADVRNVMGH